HVVAGERPARVGLPEGETVIGRDLGCGLVLSDPQVSRRHARVVRRGERAWVEDLGSAWGTLLNGGPVEGRAPLAAGDELRLGGVTLRYAVRFRAAYPDWRPAVKFLAWPLALGAGCCLVAPDAWRMFFLLALAAFWLGCDGAARAGPSPPPGAGPLL